MGKKQIYNGFLLFLVLLLIFVFISIYLEIICMCIYYIYSSSCKNMFKHLSIILETVSFNNKTIIIQLTYELDLHKFYKMSCILTQMHAAFSSLRLTCTSLATPITNGGSLPLIHILKQEET